MDRLEPAEPTHLEPVLSRELAPHGHVLDPARWVGRPHDSGARLDERPVALHRLLELRSRGRIGEREVTELLIRMLELLGHRVALLELMLELHGLILKLLAGDGELLRRVHRLGAAVPELVERGAEEARDRDEDESAGDLVRCREDEGPERLRRREVGQDDADHRCEQRGPEAATPCRVRARHPEQQQPRRNEVVTKLPGERAGHSDGKQRLGEGERRSQRGLELRRRSSWGKRGRHGILFGVALLGLR